MKLVNLFVIYGFLVKVLVHALLYGLNSIFSEKALKVRNEEESEIGA